LKEYPYCLLFDSFFDYLSDAWRDLAADLFFLAAKVAKVESHQKKGGLWGLREFRLSFYSRFFGLHFAPASASLRG
jgi:hypothetical protein